MPNLKFLDSIPFHRYGRGPIIPKLGQVTSRWPQWPNFSVFPLVPLGVHLHAKFRVSSCYRYRDTDGVPKFHNWVTWLPGVPRWPNFSDFPLVPLGVRLRAKFRVSSCHRSRDTEGHQGVTWPNFGILGPLIRISGTVAARNSKFGTQTDPEGN